MKGAHSLCNRYPDEANNVLIDKIAKINNVNRDQIVLGDGSSEILKLCAETFTGPTEGKLVVADPTFEAIFEYSKACGAEIVKVALTSSYAHDLEKMGVAAQKGLIYICNPNLIVARTFSKIYGMAGLRCGYGVAQPETIKKMHGLQMWDSVNVMALAAASASLDDVDQVKNGRRMNNEAKSLTLTELEKLGYKSIPSQANFIMFDCKKSVVPLIKAMKEKNVAVGRLFPAMPNHMRLTIGKKAEMESFVSAFKQVIAA